MTERTDYYLGVIDAIRRHFVVASLGLVVGFFAGLGVVKTFFTDTFPWLLSDSGAAVSVVAAVIAAVVAFYYFVQYGRYRRAIRKAAWLYTIDVQDAQAGQEGHGPGQSDAVKRGEASADKVWGDRFLDQLGVPHENEYR